MYFCVNFFRSDIDNDPKKEKTKLVIKVHFLFYDHS